MNADTVSADTTAPVDLYDETKLKGLRRIIVWVIIVSLVITAGVGIATLLSGEMGETQSKVLITTLAIAGFSVTALCHLAVLNRDVRVVGWAGIVSSALGLVAALMLIWRTWDYEQQFIDQEFWDLIQKSFFVLLISALSFAHANLMLLLAHSTRRWMRMALGANLILITLVAVMVIPVVISEGEFPGALISDTYWRLFGVVAILDALGTIALPVTTLIMRRQHDGDHVAAPVAASATSHIVAVSLPTELSARVTERATAAGVTPEQFVTDTVAQALAQSDS
ncbi:MAG: hypothetical protein ACKOWP_06685 [Microbacteriaceae bacterium]